MSNEPLSRNELLINALLTGDKSGIKYPQSRVEELLLRLVDKNVLNNGGEVIDMSLYAKKTDVLEIKFNSETGNLSITPKKEA